MNLTPLSDRVLIRPDSAPTMTASGLHLAEHWKPEQTGTVVAVGNLTPSQRVDVKVGDYVIFSWQAGQEIWVNDGEERYLLMRALDVLAVIEPGEPASEAANGVPV